MPSYEVFLIAFIVSYLGSIPPGTVNISVMQLSINNHRAAAIYLGFAASMVELFYVAITVQFQRFLSSSEELSFYFQIITASALIIIGVINLFSKTKSETFLRKTAMRRRTGFLRGLVLGFLNPMTIPFWLVVTNYLVSHNWVEVEGSNFWAYITGLALGTFVLLVTVDFLGKNFQKIADNTFIVHRIPGFILIGMGIYNAIKLF